MTFVNRASISAIASSINIPRRKNFRSAMLSNRVRCLDAPLGGGPLREQPLEYAPRDPDHAVVFADLDPELHRLPVGIPAVVLGGRRLGNDTPRAMMFAGAIGGFKRQALGRLV
jgi:hypothetical protein